MTLIYWFARTIKGNGYFSIRPYIKPLVIIAFILFITGLLSVYAVSNSKQGLIGSVFRNFIVTLIWPVIISYTIKNIEGLTKFIYFYAVARIVEVGLFGTIIYLYFYQELWLFNSQYNLGLEMLDLDHSARLLTIGAPNSNDAAFVLLGAFGFLAYRLFKRIKIFDLIMCIIAFFGMLFTWTRSVWPFVALYFLLFLGLNKKKSKIVVLFFCIIAGSISMFTIQAFQNERVNDLRLQTNDNFLVRVQQTTDYIIGIPKLPLLWGLYDDPKKIAVRLSLVNPISSENYTLDIFTKHGIIAGFCFILFFVYFIFSFWKTTKVYCKITENKRYSAFVVAFFAVFVSSLLMAQTTLLRSNQILWIMIGGMSVIKQNTYIRR